MMTDSKIQSKNQRAARILTVACGLLFGAFSFVYLYIFQNDAVEALHYSLSQGRTEYAPMATALVFTIVLLLLRWGVNALLGLKGMLRELSYFPSFLILGVMADVDYTIYQEGISDTWIWLFPLLIVGYIMLAFLLRHIYRCWFDAQPDAGMVTFSNLTIFLLLCFMTMGIGNTDIHFHHELGVERAIRQADYAEARQIGAKVMDPSRTLSALRAYAMSKEGTLGEYLFEYPQPYAAEGLLLQPGNTRVLRVTTDSLHTYLGDRRNPGERALDFFQRICSEETGNHTTLEYYLSALLLEKQLEKFYHTYHLLYTQGDSVPRYYKEALFLYEKLHPTTAPTVQDEAMEQQWQVYQASKEKLSQGKGEANFMRREHGTTYWWYYQY